MNTRARWALLALLAASLLLGLTLTRASVPNGQRQASQPTPATADAAATLTPPPPTPTAQPTSTPPPTPTPQPRLTAATTAAGGSLTFSLRGEVPAGASEALLWYDTAAGRQVRSVPLAGGQEVSATVVVSAAQALAPGDLGDGRALDYWWAVRDGAGGLVRTRGSAALPAEIAAIGQAAPPTPTLAIDWVERATPHFRLLAPPGTDGARDLERLAQVAEAGFAQAAQVISPTGTISVPVYLVPRVFWQGGVAYGDGGPLIISYLDRNYAGVEPWSYFVHEVTHALGAALLPEGSEVGGVLGEGVAVYATGGHYSVEPIDARAASLAAGGRAIRLCELRYDFYAAQHEIAYIESASYVGFLIRTYGLDTFYELYRQQEPQRGNRDQSLEQFCAASDAEVADPTGRTNAELEQAWLASLAQLTPTASERDGMLLTVRLYDTMRRYQEQLDPPARLLPPPPKEWDTDTALRMLTPAAGPRAAALETMLVAAADALRQGDSARAAALLDSVEASLDGGGAPADALGGDYAAAAGLLEEHARALRLGDEQGLAGTLADPALAARLPFGAGDLLRDLRVTPLQLDIRGDAAEGLVELRAEALDGRRVEDELFAVRLVRAGRGWALADWAPHRPTIELPPGQPAR